MYVDKTEIAKIFKIPVSTVDYLRRKGVIPSIPIGRHHRYDLKEVERCLKGKIIINGRSLRKKEKLAYLVAG
jgi:hypothetical protein